MKNKNYQIREAAAKEFNEIGKLMVEVYSSLDGFPKPHQQPDYYKMLANIGSFTQKPKTKLIIAKAQEESIGGAVIYVGDMKYYGSGGIATNLKNAAGFRLLAVSPTHRGKGLGKLLTEKCIQVAKEEKHKELIIHSTKAMKIAWKMYEKLGFKRAPELDFMQESLPVFGFRLVL